MLDPSVQAILEAPSVTYIPASAFMPAVGVQLVPLPGGEFHLLSFWRLQIVHMLTEAFQVLRSSGHSQVMQQAQGLCLRSHSSRCR